jgi:subtilisin family serine protease
MERTSGSPDVIIGLIDGPVDRAHPDLAGDHVRDLSGAPAAVDGGRARLHGTFVAGILCAKRSSAAPAICPGCTVVVRPIFNESSDTADGMPRSTPGELARAILDCLDAGARVLNISAAIAKPTINGDRVLKEALDRAASRGVIVVVAAGNEGTLGGTTLTSHPWVIPVAACDLRGRPSGYSNLGHSIGRRGLGAPGDRIISLGAAGASLTLSGTSAAAPFVTGAIALLWSEFAGATAPHVRRAIVRTSVPRRAAVVPPLLDAWEAHQSMRR